MLLRIATHSAWSAVGGTAARFRVTATSSPAANGRGVTSIGTRVPSSTGVRRSSRLAVGRRRRPRSAGCRPATSRRSAARCPGWPRICVRSSRSSVTWSPGDGRGAEQRDAGVLRGQPHRSRHGPLDVVRARRPSAARPSARTIPPAVIRSGCAVDRDIGVAPGRSRLSTSTSSFLLVRLRRVSAWACRSGGSAQIVGWPTNIVGGGPRGGPGGLERAGDGPGADQPAQQRGSPARARAGRSPGPGRARRRPGSAARRPSGSVAPPSAAKRRSSAVRCSSGLRSTSPSDRPRSRGGRCSTSTETSSGMVARSSAIVAGELRAAGRRAGTSPARSRRAAATAGPGRGGRRWRS